MSDLSSSSAFKLMKNNKVQLECLDLFEYLKTQPQETLEKLYYDPALCLAIYRQIPEIGKQFVIRILFVEQPVPQAVVLSWGSQLYAK
jgi:transcription initiation factor TFIIH subunit 4